MKGNTSLLKSNYIIDGIRMNATPEAMLDIACENDPCPEEEHFEALIDESVDPSPFTDKANPEKIKEYVSLIEAMNSRKTPICHCGEFTKNKIAKALIEKIWSDGHFRLGDLAIEASWDWNQDTVGNLAALYASIEASCDYLDGLGLKMKNYSVSEKDELNINVNIKLSDQSSTDIFDLDEENFFDELPFKTEHPIIKAERKCREKAIAKPGNWIIYIPFDTCPLHLGSSALSEATGLNLGKAVNMESPDYFIDCYEVVRELVEDGIALAGQTVTDGGMISALKRIVPQGKAFHAEIGGIMKSYSEHDITNIAFSEVPGVLIEISDEDYDYVDAELLLQDVAYYPLGSFNGEEGEVEILASDNSDITTILHSLLHGQVSEGED